MTPVGAARVPAVEGWFTTGDDGRAPGTARIALRRVRHLRLPGRGRALSYPDCDSTSFSTVEPSRRGRVWSYTDARYQPPPPYVAAEPYEPFCLAADELAEEKMVVMGQVVPGVSVDDLSVGDEVELVVDTLYSDPQDGTEHLVWKWRPGPGKGS